MNKEQLLKNLIVDEKSKNDYLIEEYKNKLKDRYWRLNNLYWIKDKKGRKIKFKFNQTQEYLYKNLWYFSVILKARQLGITTFFCILYLDAVLFESNKTAKIIAHTEKDASDIFEDKVKFAFNSLPESLKNQLEIKTDSSTQLSFKNGSSISVSVSTRSGTVQYLHISELGYTSQKYPEKAEEIVTGSINSVEKGCLVSVESTAKGREGYFFDICQQAQNLQRLAKKLTQLEFKFFFFPWFNDLEYTLDSNDVLPQHLLDYFKKLEFEGIKLNEGQKQWYFSKYKLLKEKMYSEYPSMPEEAFISSIEGAYYEKQIAEVHKDKRIGFVPLEKKAPIDIWWDLGRNDFNVILFTQYIGKEIRFIDCYWNRGEGLPHYVSILQKKRDELGYIYNSHYLPWDVEIKELSTNKTRLDTLRELGLTNIKVVPKLSIEEGIDMVRGIFNKFWFDETKCARLIEAIINYRHDWDDKLGTFKSEPRHDDHSHFCDALRSIGVCYQDLSGEIIEIKESFDKTSLFPQF